MIELLQKLSITEGRRNTEETFNTEIAEIAERFDRFDAAPRSGGVGLRGSEYKPDGFTPGLYSDPSQPDAQAGYAGRPRRIALRSL